MNDFQNHYLQERKQTNKNINCMILFMRIPEILLLRQRTNESCLGKGG